MARIRCDKGHHYDPAQHSECPECGVSVIEMNENTLRHSNTPALGERTTWPPYGAKFNGEPFNPVVGWLVCTEGSDKGRDYQLAAGRNFIVEKPDMHIVPADGTFVPEHQGSVLHDPHTDKFYLMPGGEKVQGEIFYQDKALSSSVELTAYDTFRLRDATLLFVPLCGPQFQWKK